MNNYSQEVIDFVINQEGIVIVVLKDDSVYVGTLVPGYGSHYKVVPPTINDGGIGFPRSYIKQIVFFNGLVFPKEMSGPHKMLNIIELNDLVNKAGYEFI